jgi:hypothetical protein
MKMAAINQVILIGLPSLLLLATIVVILFSAADAVEEEMTCPQLYNRSRIEQSPPRPIDCRVYGESVGAFFVSYACI